MAAFDTEASKYNDAEGRWYMKRLTVSEDLIVEPYSWYLTGNKELHDDDDTLAEADSGIVHVITADAKTFTLPGTAAGLTFVIVNGGEDGEVGVSVSPHDDDKIMGAGFTSANNKDAINTKATAKKGDYIVLVGDGADGYCVQAVRGIWAREA